jgi:Protein of unknown function (DUF1045)
MDYENYAIWWVPRPGTALAEFGAEWTGWCADRGTVAPDPSADRPAGKCRSVPRSLVRRGLHASIRAPFRLSPGRSRWALEDALAELAELHAPITLPPLELTVVDGQVALAPAWPDRAAAGLVAAVAEATRPFALPQPHAAPGARANGTGWRAPSRNRLHLLLTERIDPDKARPVVAELEAQLAPVLARRQRIGDLALVGDPGGGRPWRLLQRHALAGEPARMTARVPSGMDWRGPSLLTPLAGGAATR